jgi:hypothetical protein
VADSFYHVIEMRIVDLDPTSSDSAANVEVFVKISDANDFMPIAGWYGARVPTGRMSFEFLQASIIRQSYLMGEDGWTKRDPAAAAQDERSPSYDALAIIVNNFCAALQAHGIGDDYDTPTEALEALVAKAKQAPAPTVEQTSVALCLVGDTEHITDQIIATWTDEQRQEAFDWAMAVHYRASDNDDVEVPVRPVFTIAGAQETARG